jgi:electron transfer flavoprotein alpha subunit
MGSSRLWWLNRATNVQHLAGISCAGAIVAINKDAVVPIFEAACTGLVDDLLELPPGLEATLG